MKTKFQPKRRAAFISFSALILFGAAACNTTRGLGRDMQKLGSQIEEEAVEHTRY